MKTETELDVLIRARYPIIWLETYEEGRAIRLVNSIGIKQGKRVLVWSATAGLCKVNREPAAESTEDPIAVLDYISENSEPLIVALLDFHRYLDDIIVYRKLRDLHSSLKATHKTIIIVSPVVNIPTELQKVITVLSLPLPTKPELEQVLNQLIKTLKASSSDTSAVQQIISNLDSVLNNGQRDLILSAGLGLTEDEFENVLAKSIVSKHTIDVSAIISEKEQIIKKSGLLEYYHSTANMADVGGLAVLKQWIAQRRLAFSRKAREFGLRTPKGVFLAGPPGTGKSLTAKVIAATMEMPLLRLDVSRVYSSLVGSSEQNISQALKTAEAVAPSILWVDEVEKAMAGVQSSGALDSGVTARVFATFLTWLQEHESPVFVVVTCNQPAIPPEFMRAGRFDEVFLVDLPNTEERAEIFRIHITKVKRDPNKYSIAKFAEATDGFSGAEIEAVVQDALYSAFYDDDDLSDDYIMAAIQRTVPLSKKRKDEVEALRRWGQINAVNASAFSGTAEAETRRIEL